MFNKKLFLNKEVRDFLLDGSIHDQLDRIAAENEIPEERSEEFLDLTDAIMAGKIGIEKMPEFIARAFGVGEDKSKKIAADLAGYRLLPLENYIPDVAKNIKAWGGVISDYPELRVKREEYSIEKFLVDYAKKLGLDLPEYLIKRFTFLAKGYLTKTRTREATLTFLTRQFNIGGLGLSKDQALNLLTKLDEVDLSNVKGFEKKEIVKKEIRAEVKKGVIKGEFNKTVKKINISSLPPALSIEKQEKADISPPTSLPIKENSRSYKDKKKVIERPDEKDLLPILSVSQALTKEVPVISGSIISGFEDEIREHSEKLQRKLQGIDREEEFDYSDIISKIIVLFGKSRQNKKTIYNFVNRFVRGVINKKQILLLLQNKYRIDFEAANKILDILEAQKLEIDTKNKNKILNKDKKDKYKIDILEKEKEVLEMRHITLTKKITDQKIEPAISGARVSLARTPAEELDIQKSKIDKNSLAEVQKTIKPKPAKVLLSASSTPPSLLNDLKSSAKVADIKFVSKLIGPVDELGIMTVAEFRRLSSNPVEAINKIIDLLKLLEDTSYEDRIKGILAWRRSPINQLYLQMITSALLQGVSITDIASDLRNKGNETLSPAEINSIIELNSKIKF